MTYPACSSPTRTRQLLKNIVPVSGTPVFSYYAFVTSGTSTISGSPRRWPRPICRES